jgi:hypothetical protein
VRWNLQLGINSAFKSSKANTTYLVANAEKSDIPVVYTRRGKKIIIIITNGN